MTGGVCGGVWDGDNRFSAGGAFATNQITGTYTAGQTMDVSVRLASLHIQRLSAGTALHGVQIPVPGLVRLQV